MILNFCRKILLLFVLSEILISFVTSTSHADDNEILTRFINSSEDCFRSYVASKKEKFKFSPYDDAFLAQELSIYIDSSENQYGEQAAAAFCQSVLIPKYWKAYQSAEENIKDKKARKPDLAKLTQQVHLDDKFVQITANAFIDHTVTGHTEITAMAINQLPKNLRLGQQAAELVIAASQTPDLYRWKDDRYHAVTCPKPNVKSLLCQKSEQINFDRDFAIKGSQTLFIQLMKNIAKEIKKQASSGQDGAALLLMGAACHSLEDLAFHEGMTSAQHAGLSYVLKQDPDDTSSFVGKQKVQSAVKNCALFLKQMVREAIFHSTNIVRWKPKETFSLKNLARSVYQTETDMSTASLLEYWKLSKIYKRDRELRLSLSDRENGLIVWNTKKVMQRVMKAIKQ